MPRVSPIDAALRAAVDALANPVAERAAGEDVFAFVEDAFPLFRSLTGDGVRQTLAKVGQIAPGLQVHEVPSGTPVLDWVVPKEWRVHSARLLGPDGATIVDVEDHTLHLLGYSAPYRGTLSLDALRPHLWSDPERPDAIPYRTSYYREEWGFCLEHRRLEALVEGEYRVEIETELFDGSLTYGEIVLPGECEGEVLVSAHVCHPSLANDNLSALGVAAHLARRLAELPRRRLTWRFIFAPGTLGAIVWLAGHREIVDRVRHGLVLSNLGDGGAFHFKRTRGGASSIDRLVPKVFADSSEPLEVEDFSPFGYDERQYGSPGFDLPVAVLSRTPWGRYPEYHTSDDDLRLVRPQHLGRSLRRLLEVASALEHDRRWRNLEPYGEPQLGRRGLYHQIGGGDEGRTRQLALLWVLNQSDGGKSLLDVAERSGLSMRQIEDAAEALWQAELLAAVDD
ncbi:MAG: DUF4910 domain-containing protein [Acidobacteriota bacterium]